MKAVNLIFFLLMFGIISCKKERHQKEDAVLRSVQLSLRDSMGKDKYEMLDFERMVRYTIERDNKVYLQIAYKGKTVEESFLMLLLNPNGTIIKGRQIAIDRVKEQGSSSPTFNGKVWLRSLSGAKINESNLQNGYIQKQHPIAGIASVESLHPDPYQTMPTVVVTATRNTDQTVTYHNWMSMQYIMGDGGGSNIGYYTSLSSDVYGGVSYGGGYAGSGTGLSEEMLLVDFETQGSLPGIDVAQYLHCFGKIPDAGATYSIEIFADIPVDKDPNKIFDINSGSPGHTFVQIKKSNGSQSAMQNIGFYPKLGWKPALTNAPMEGKFVDNGEHEFNASFKLNLSQQNFNSVLTEILYLANFIRYDIDNYNCTDFALDVFNKTRRDKLEIPLIHIPGNYPSTGTRTPQGIYSQLKQMKQSGHPESANITINIQKGWVAKSTGPCN